MQASVPMSHSPLRPLAPASQDSTPNSIASSSRHASPGSPRPSHAVRRAKRTEVVAREKTGCWSCRIRRKKCHGKEPGQASCVDCVRLGIDCLGWGEKRPEWLRKTIDEQRGNFKHDLMARNMIKGQRKNGLNSPRTTMSPQSRDVSPESTPVMHSNGYHSNGMQSNGMYQHSNGMHSNGMHSNGMHTNGLHSNGNDLHSNGMHSNGLHSNGVHTVYGAPSRAPPTYYDPISPPQTLLTAETLCRLHVGHMESAERLQDLPPQPRPALIPKQQSVLVPPMLAYNNQYFPHVNIPGSGAMTYDPIHRTAAASNRSIQDSRPSMIDWGHRQADKLMTMAQIQDPDALIDEEIVRDPMELCLQQIPQRVYSSSLDPEQWQWFTHYDKEVLPMQYLMQGQETRQLMLNVALSSDMPAAMLCLAAVHHHQLHPNYTPHARDKFWLSAINSISGAPRTAQDALTALHLVSVSLFSGCQPEWSPFLNKARDWCQAAFPGSDGNSFRRALLGSDPLTKFVSKTTMWMDIFGAISSQTVPRFLPWYRALFHPRNINVSEIGAEGDPAINMDATMGCDNEIMLAFAEIAALDAWKLEDVNSWSTYRLVEHANRIRTELLDAGRTTRPHAPAGYSPPAPGWRTFTADGQDDSAEQEVLMTRRQMSAVFRAAANIYLHTVVSGCRPKVPEIQLAVAETISGLKAIQSTDRRPYDRSLVLPLFIAGVMTDDPEQQNFIKSRLSGIKDISVGNCGQVLSLMARVWEKRRLAGGAEISWRDTMKEMNMKLLFV